jgi:uncharacterized protein (TIGR03083 family)
MDWSWAGPPLDVRPLFPAERAELVALLGSLEPPDWQRATVCPGWRVHEVAAHLVHDYLRKLSGRRDAAGGPGPRAGEDLAAWLHRMNQEFVDVAARWSPRVLIDLLTHLGPQLDDLWAALDLTTLGEAVSWAAPGVPAPVWLDVAREYSEYWVHQQQIRDAVQRPGASSGTLAGPVIDTFVRAVPYTLRAASAGPGAGVQLEVRGPAGGSWAVTRLDAGWAIRPGRGDAPEVTITLTADVLWRVATRGITVAAAAGQTHFAGDRDLGLAALALVSIIR